MANWINLYPTQSDYTADKSARDALGPTVSMIAADGQLHYDKAGSPVDPYNPLGLPPFTIRVKFSSGYTPSMGDSQTLVDAGENVWDIYNNSTDWERLFRRNSDVIAVLGANTTGVTLMGMMFNKCTSLATIPLFDTLNVTSMAGMFQNCTSLTTIPLFDTSNVTQMNMTFSGCTSVNEGALALYQQASTQSTPPDHDQAFKDCGSNTPTGQAELAQIPSDWK